MNITEKHHAYLVGCYYKTLKTMFGEEGIKTFIEATKKYAEQRGHRMALRAEKHGFKKDYLGYFTHGEWEATNPQSFDIHNSNSKDGDRVTYNYRCPWHETFDEMDLLECGKVYCQYIDKHIVKGFNPQLVLDVTSLIYSSDCCTFHWRNANFNEDTEQIIQEVNEKYEEENIRTFTYHTAHLHKTFKDKIIEKFGIKGLKVVEETMGSFEQKYGDKVKSTIQEYEIVDFDTID